MRCRRADVNAHTGKMSVRPDGALVIVAVLTVAVMLVSQNRHISNSLLSFGFEKSLRAWYFLFDVVTIHLSE